MKIRLTVLQLSRAERQMGMGKLAGLFFAIFLYGIAKLIKTAMEKGSFYKCRGRLHSVSLVRFILGSTTESHQTSRRRIPDDSTFEI